MLATTIDCRARRTCPNWNYDDTFIIFSRFASFTCDRECAHATLLQWSHFIESIMKFWSIINRVCNGLTIRTVLSSSHHHSHFYLLTFHRHRWFATPSHRIGMSLVLQLPMLWKLILFESRLRRFNGNLCSTNAEELCLKVLLQQQNQVEQKSLL